MTDREYMRWAYEEAAKSGDLSSQNGAILVGASGRVIGVGRNDVPAMCCDTPERRQRPAKYAWTEHAERAAIFDAARDAAETTIGATLYCPWLACADCGRAIVLCGIKRVVRHKIPQHAQRPDWAASIAAADQMFREAGVKVDEIEGEIGVTFRFNGEQVAA